MEDPVQVGRYFFVDFRTEVAAKCIVSRCILLQACFRIVDNMQLGTMNMLAKYFLKTYPDCFLPGKAENLVDVKALNKRLRSPKEKEALMGQFTRLDIEAFCKVHDSGDQVTLLAGKNMCCMGFLIAQGLSPSSGSCNGRVGGGIAAKFSLRDRPYTGVTTMDPELALVMANAARVKKSDIVLDPFAGSCGVLLACSYFGMGMGFAQDISQSTLRGEGPGRDIAANFDAFHFYRPEIALADVTNPMWRKTWEIDAIVCDPPYGVRTFGSHTDEIFGFDDQYISELIVKWSPYLVKGGRIVFYACGPPNHYEILKSYLNNLTCAYNLEVVSIIESVVHLENTESSTKWSRSLVTLEKTGAFISIPLHELKTIKVHQSSSRQKPWNIERNMDPFDVWRAAWLGDLSSIKEYASRGGDLNLQDVAGKTALFFAAGYNQLETVKFLATKVPIDTMDIQGMTPLFQAARHGNPEIMEVLLSLGADPCTMNSKRLFPAYYAATYGHSEILRLLFKHSENSILLKGPGHATVLHRAAECGHLSAVQTLLDLNPALAFVQDWMGRTYTFYAVKCGHLDVLRFANLTTIETDAEGNSLLHEAVRNGRHDCAKWLVGQFTCAMHENNQGVSPFQLSKTKEMKIILSTTINQ